MMGQRQEGEGRGGKGEGQKHQVGQSMQILPEQRANQGARQPLQRSGLPLVTGRKEVREDPGIEWWRERSMRGRFVIVVLLYGIPGIPFLEPATQSHFSPATLCDFFSLYVLMIVKVY